MGLWARPHRQPGRPPAARQRTTPNQPQRNKHHPQVLTIARAVPIRPVVRTRATVMACLPRCPVRRRNAAVVCLRTAGWTHHDEPPLTAPLPPRAEALRVTAPITPARYPPSPSLDKYWLLADICALVSGRVT